MKKALLICSLLILISGFQAIAVPVNYSAFIGGRSRSITNDGSCWTGDHSYSPDAPAIPFMDNIRHIGPHQSPRSDDNCQHDRVIPEPTTLALLGLGTLGLGLIRKHRK